MVLSHLVAGPLAVLLLAGGAVKLPFGFPPGKEDALVASAVPQQPVACMVWASSAEANPTRPHQFERLVADPEIQRWLADLSRVVFDAVISESRKEGPAEERLARLVWKWGWKVAKEPGAVFLSRLDLERRRPDVQLGLVSRLGQQASQLLDELDKLRSDIAADVMKRQQIGEATVFRLRLGGRAPLLSLGVRDQYFFAAVGEGVIEGMLQRAGGSPPKWLTDAQQQLPVPRRSITAYFDAAWAIDHLAAALEEEGGRQLLEAAGLASVTHLACVSGLDDEQVVTRALIGLDGPPTGVLAAVTAPPLRRTEIAPVADDATLAVVARLDAQRLFDAVRALVRVAGPDVLEHVDQDLDQLRQTIGFDLRRDLLGALGDSICVYHSPTEGGLLGGWTAVLEVKDANRIRGVIQALTAAARRAHEARGGTSGQLYFGQLSFAGHEIGFVEPSPRRFPFAPSWCLKNQELILALFPQNIKAYLARRAQKGSRDGWLRMAREVPFDGSNPRGKGPQAPAPFRVFEQKTYKVYELAQPALHLAGRYFFAEMRDNDIDMRMVYLPSGLALRRHLFIDLVTASLTERGIEITCRESFPGSSMLVVGPLAAAMLGTGTGADFEKISRQLTMDLSPAAALQARSIGDDFLKALVTRNGGEAVQLEP